ncbi:MAG: cation transporter [Marinilabiliaceae bacterium]|nr:cation transporter [Marinilabiliaceae bacterium]
MAHLHDHPNCHHTRQNLNGKRLLGATLLNFFITIIQLVGGVLSNSLALFSDALHNLGDTLAIALAYAANRLSHRKADFNKTFGYKRLEILAAFMNAFLLVIICIYLCYEAAHRFFNPEPIKSVLMLSIAFIGLLANLGSVLLLNKEKNNSINTKAAYLHLMGDTLSSVAVIVGGVLIWQFQFYWIDPLITAILAIYIIHHTWHVLKESFNILMQATPSGVSVIAISQRLEKIKIMSGLHHVHIWQLNDDQLHFEGHVVVSNDCYISETQLLSQQIKNILKQEFSIDHVTLQMEYAPMECKRDLIYHSEYKTNSVLS